MDAKIALVGEAPGDEEDKAGRPFVGPAGRVLDGALQRAGLDRAAVYLTNAVKHFKFEPAGGRRIHKTPRGPEISACRDWLAAELTVVKPKLIVALGATAAMSLLGRRVSILRERGRVQDSAFGPVLVTFHPSALLRQPDAAAQAEFTRLFEDDSRSIPSYK